MKNKCPKKKHTTKKAAKAEADRIAARELFVGNDVQMAVYKNCEHGCRGWHVGTRKSRPADPRQPRLHRYNLPAPLLRDLRNHPIRPTGEIGSLIPAAWRLVTERWPEARNLLDPVVPGDWAVVKEDERSDRLKEGEDYTVLWSALVDCLEIMAPAGCYVGVSRGWFGIWELPRYKNGGLT